jgi:tetratricopeptide (TPR) repeat protein
MAQAKHAALYALEHDSGSAAAHACLGFVLALERDMSAAQRSFDRSCVLGLGPTGHRQYALVLTAQGRFEDARYQLEKAQAMDPFSCRQKIARSRILYLSRRYEELIQEHECPHLYGAQPAESQLFQALAHLELGQFDEAMQLAHAMRREAQAHPQLLASTAEFFARCGDLHAAKAIAERLDLFSLESPISSLRQALLALALGDQARAMSALMTSNERQEAELLWLRVDPRFDLVRESSSVRKLDAWHHGPSLKPADPETKPSFHRYSVLDRFVEDPRVA